MLICVTIFCVWLSRHFPRTQAVAQLDVSVLSWTPLDCATHLELVRSPLVITAAINDGGLQQLPILEQQEDAQIWLQQNVKVRYPSDNDVMEISVSGKPPEHAQLAQIVDAIVAEYLEFLNKSVPQAQGITVIKSAGRH